MASPRFPRDLVGYGRSPPHARWPNDARIAVSFVVNYEAGGESCVLNGDPASEHLLSEIVGAKPLPGVRHLNMESLYDYEARAGVWRLIDIFKSRNVPATAYMVGQALERNPAVGLAMKDAGWEIASHGYRWLDYQYIGEDVEREHIRKAVAAHERILGERPLGIYQGKPGPNTRRLVCEEQGFLYDCDSYADDLPYWEQQADGSMMMILPYSLDNNDMRFAQGLECQRFYEFLKDAFDRLYEEGETRPKMMSIGLHGRVAGRPGRARALERFIDYVLSKERVWICRRVEIARHWYKMHPHPQPQKPAKL